MYQVMEDIAKDTVIPNVHGLGSVSLTASYHNNESKLKKYNLQKICPQDTYGIMIMHHFLNKSSNYHHY